MVNTQSTFHTWSTDGQHGQQTVNTAPEDFPVDELGLSPWKAVLGILSCHLLRRCYTEPLKGALGLLIELSDIIIEL